MHTRFILLQTSHAGNVGAVARAMKVMGFDDLVLVQPRWEDVLQRQEAIERSSGATDVLEKARIVHTWEEAVCDIDYLCATVMTPRNFGPPTLEPRACFTKLAQGRSAGSVPAPQSVGLVFGSERYGMQNDDVYRCHVCLRIPVNPEYGSLNIAAAAQVLAYEWRLALGGFALEDLQKKEKAENAGSAENAVGVSQKKQSVQALADAAQVQAALAHWEQALVAIGYLDPAAPKKLVPRLQQIFNRAQLREDEIHILRGIAKAILQASHQPTKVVQK